VTTRITVTTDNGGLLDRNAQQQAAARQATLLKSQADKAAALGDDQLRRERIAQGRDPATGRPLPSTGSTLNRVDQQPAAFRRSSGLSFVVEPSLNTEDDIQVLTKPRDPLITSYAGQFSPGTVFNGDGPQGTNSFGAGPDILSADALITDPSYRINLLSAGDPPGLTETLVPGYIPYNPSVTTSHPLRKYKSFTIEFYFRILDTNVLLGGPSVFVELPGVTILVSRGLDFATGYNSFLEVGIGGIVPSSISAGIIREGFEYWRLRGGNNPAYDIAIPPFGDTWNHIAIVKDRAVSRIILNGSTIASGQFYSDYYDRYTYMQENLVAYYSRLGDLFPATRFRVTQNTNQYSRLHGLRWTSKALYGSGAFTPPASITLPA
jgi:hypothetical protein